MATIPATVQQYQALAAEIDGATHTSRSLSSSRFLPAALSQMEADLARAMSRAVCAQMAGDGTEEGAAWGQEAEMLRSMVEAQLA